MGSEMCIRDRSVDATTGAPLPYKDAFNQANTLADVAYYYYQTPLRSDALGNCSNTIGGTTYTNLCDNNVRGSGKDLNSKQHMTSFTIGLGVSGTIKYESDYESAAKDADASTNQYYDVVNGTVNWPTVTVNSCLLYTSPSPRDLSTSRMPSSA